MNLSMKKLFRYAGEWSIKAYKKQEEEKKKYHPICGVKYENVLEDYLKFVWDQERLKNKPK